MYFISNQNDISTQHCVLFLFSFLFCSVHADGWAAMGLWGESSYLPRMPHDVLININKLATVYMNVFFLWIKVWICFHMNKQYTFLANLNWRSVRSHRAKLSVSCNKFCTGRNVQRVGQDGQWTPHFCNSYNTSANTQIKMHKYKFTSQNSQAQMNTNTNT